MANSVRQQVMSAVVAALETIIAGSTYVTTLASVSESLPEGPVENIDLKDVPACFPIDADEDRMPALVGDDQDNMEGRLTVLITCVVHSATNSTRQARNDLMRDVEKALLNDTSLASLILDIEPTRITTDKGVIPNFSVWDQEFLVSYRYNRTDGG
jgi:hypothetical protein